MKQFKLQPVAFFIQGKFVGLPPQWLSLIQGAGGGNSNRPKPIIDPSNITPTEIMDIKSHTIVRGQNSSVNVATAFIAANNKDINNPQISSRSLVSRSNSLRRIESPQPLKQKFNQFQQNLMEHNENVINNDQLPNNQPIRPFNLNHNHNNHPSQQQQSLLNSMNMESMPTTTTTYPPSTIMNPLLSTANNFIMANRIYPARNPTPVIQYQIPPQPSNGNFHNNNNNNINHHHMNTQQQQQQSMTARNVYNSNKIRYGVLPQIQQAQFISHNNNTKITNELPNNFHNQQLNIHHHQQQQQPSSNQLQQTIIMPNSAMQQFNNNSSVLKSSSTMFQQQENNPDLISTTNSNNRITNATNIHSNTHHSNNYINQMNLNQNLSNMTIHTKPMNSINHLKTNGTSQHHTQISPASSMNHNNGGGGQETTTTGIQQQHKNPNHQIVSNAAKSMVVNNVQHDNVSNAAMNQNPTTTTTNSSTVTSATVQQQQRVTHEQFRAALQMVVNPGDPRFVFLQ